MALSGRIRLREGTTRSTEDIVTRAVGSRCSAGRRRRGRRRGKSERPDRGDAGALNSPPSAKEGDAADEEVSKARRKTTSRRSLEQQPHFDEISPEVGELDEEAVEQAMEEDPDETLALLADLTGATDPKLRELARRLAGRLFLDLASVVRRPRGVGQLTTQRYRPDGGDLDVDASLDALTTAAAEGSTVDPDDLRIRAWSTPGTAICLLVDRSGSMTGRPLATAAVAASSVAWRSPDDYSVLSFGKDVIAAKSQDVPRSNEQVIDAVLALRGFGTTDVAGALTAAADQLTRSRAGRKITVLLSDCRATAPGDVIGRRAEARRAGDRGARVRRRRGAGTRRAGRCPVHHGAGSVRRSCGARPRPRHLSSAVRYSGLTPGSRCAGQQEMFLSGTTPKTFCRPRRSAGGVEGRVGGVGSSAGSVSGRGSITGTVGGGHVVGGDGRRSR